MNIEWEIDLPTNADSKDYHYESPIYCDDDVLYFITKRPNTILHIVDTNAGKEKIQQYFHFRKNKARPYK